MLNKKISIIVLFLIIFSVSNFLFADNLFELKKEADLYFNMGNYNKAINIYKKILLHKEIDPKLSGFISYKIGRCYELLKEYKNALEYYYKSLKINKKLLDYNAINIIYFRLGTVFDKVGNVEYSITCFKNAYSISNALGTLNVKAHCSFKLGILYSMKNENGTSLRYFMNSLKYHTEHKNKKNMGVILYYIGNIFKEANRISDSIHIWKISIKLLKETNSNEWKIVEESLKNIDN